MRLACTCRPPSCQMNLSQPDERGIGERLRLSTGEGADHVVGVAHSNASALSKGATYSVIAHKFPCEFFVQIAGAFRFRSAIARFVGWYDLSARRGKVRQRGRDPNSALRTNSASRLDAFPFFFHRSTMANARQKKNISLQLCR